MLKEKDDVLHKALLLFDGALVCGSFILAYLIRVNIRSIYSLDIFPENLIIAEHNASLGDYMAALFLAVPVWLIVLHVNGMYRSLRTKKVYDIVWILLKSALMVFLAYGSLLFILKFEFISRLFFIIFMALSFFVLLSEKMFILVVLQNLRRKGYNTRNTLVIGAGPRAQKFVEKVTCRPEWGINILGVLDDDPKGDYRRGENLKIIGDLNEISKVLHENVVDEAVFVVPRSRLNFVEKAISRCETEGIKTSMTTDLYDLKIAHCRSSSINGIPLITFETTVAGEWQLFIKRIVDIFISSMALILLSPVLIAIPILVKLTSKGPVLFKQKRIGLNGRYFFLYKFRTMNLKAQHELADLDVNRDMNGAEFRKKKLGYITKVGRILRKFSLDELPQLYNVLAGHMSLIGPRPCVLEEIKQYQPWQRRRLSMRPGLTCLWQVNGRNRIGFEEWMKLDLKYIDEWSPWLDFKILLKTIPVVLFGIGAY